MERRSVPKVLAGMAAAAQPLPSAAQQPGAAMQAFEIGELFEKQAGTDRPWV